MWAEDFVWLHSPDSGQPAALWQECTTGERLPRLFDAHLFEQMIRFVHDAGEPQDVADIDAD